MSFKLGDKVRFKANLTSATGLCRDRRGTNGLVVAVQELPANGIRIDVIFETKDGKEDRLRGISSGQLELVDDK
jgi:hypothetical protein